MKMEFVKTLELDALEAQKNYYDDPTVQNYNIVRRIIKCLAQTLLIEKAILGSVQATIELEKSYQYKPEYSGIDNKDLSLINDMSLEETEVLFKKLQFNFKSKIIGKLTAANVLESFENGDISLNEANQLMSFLQKHKQLLEEDATSLDFNVSIDKDVLDAVKAH